MKNRGIVKKIDKDSVTIEIFKDVSCSHCNSCDKKTHAIQTFSYNKNDLKIRKVFWNEEENSRCNDPINPTCLNCHLDQCCPS